MNRTEVRAFIQEGVNQLTPVVEFNEGELSDFAAQRSNRYPSTFLYLESTSTEITKSAPVDSWKIVLAIFRIDKLDSLPNVYEDLVDSCDTMAQKLVYKYRNIVSGYKLASIENVSRSKFVKSPKYGPDCLTGVELEFTLMAPDQTNVC
jgi:hypothetical protein